MLKKIIILISFLNYVFSITNNTNVNNCDSDNKYKDNIRFSVIPYYIYSKEYIYPRYQIQRICFKLSVTCL